MTTNPASEVCDIDLAEKPTIAIVSTIADAEDHIDFFIRYHTYIGIDHFFLFIDDNSQSTLKIIENNSNISYFFNDNYLHQLWKHAPIHRDITRRCLINREVMARQELNVFVAESFAKRLGIDWLLHIDLDEIFYLNGNSIIEHLRDLQKRDVGGFNYLNYEAIPLDEPMHSSIYLSSIFFKKNYFKKGHWFFSENQRKILDSVSWLKKHFFNYYQNGKSSANLHHQLIVDDVHSMRGSNGKMLNGTHKDPLVLHYPCMNLNEFRRKYGRLGRFGDLWRGLPRAGKFIDTIHLAARDAYNAGETNEFEALYRTHFVRNMSQIEFLIQHDLARTIGEVYEIGEKLGTSGKTEGSIIHSLNRDNNTYFTEPEFDLKTYVSQDLITPQSPCGTFCIVTPLVISNADFQVKHIGFKSLSEARKWLRRHPLLKKRKEAGIRSMNDNALHVIEVAGKPLIDFSDSETEKAIVKLLESKLENYDSCVLSDLDNWYFGHLSGYSEFDCEYQRLQAICRLTTMLSTGLAHRVGIALPASLDRYLLPIKGSNPYYLDLELSEAIQQTFSDNSTYPLSVFLSGRYPRSTGINWGACDIFLDSKNNQQPYLEDKALECLHALLLTLGRVALISMARPRSLERLSRLVDLKAEFHSVFQNYPCQLYAEHQNIILLRMQSDKHIFVGLFNVTTESAYISDIQVNNAGLRRTWQDLVSGKIFSFPQGNFTLNSFDYLWLIASIH